MRKTGLFFIFIFIFLFTLLLAKSISLPDLEQTYYIGQVIPLTLDLSEYKPERLLVQKETSLHQIEIFDLLDIKEKPWHYLLRIAPFDTGRVETERISLYLLQKGQTDTLYLEPFSFTVQSTLPSTIKNQILGTQMVADSLLADIASPLSFYLQFRDYFVPFLLIVLLLLAIYLGIKYSKKGILKDEKSFIDTRPAWEIALELLDKLKKKQLLEEGFYVEYYFELSMIIRIFIALEYRIKATEMTTYEIKNVLPPVKNHKQILELLSKMDMIKFAQVPANFIEAKENLAWVEKFLQTFALDREESDV